MSKFNFRLYSEQIYGLLSGYFKDYISPEINKDKFTTMYKRGKLKYENISTIKQINIHPQICLNYLCMQSVYMDIPDENEALKINLNDVICEISINSLNERQIKEMLIKERKNLINSFVNSCFNIILKKESSKSFIEDLIEKLIIQALNGLNIIINKLYLNIKYMNGQFIFTIDEFILKEEEKIISNKISLTYKENSNEYVVIPNFDINIFFKNKTKNSSDSPNLLEIKMSDFSFRLNQKIYFGILSILNCFSESYYKRIYFRYKTLIQFFQIKNKENEKKDYKSLWLYAIRTIIKLHKYVSYDKRYIFNLLNSTQEKIIKKYFDFIKDNCNKSNEINDIKLLYLDEKNILKGSKNTVKQKVIDHKKGSTLTKAFSFFWRWR